MQPSCLCTIETINHVSIENCKYFNLNFTFYLFSEHNNKPGSESNKMAASGGATYFDDVIKRNLQAAMFKRTTHGLDDRVVSMDAVDNYVVIGTAKHGCQVFK